MTKLAAREGFLFDDVDDSLEAENVECKSNVDGNDKELVHGVPSAMEISDTINGMLFPGSVEFILLYCNVTNIIT